MITIEKRRNVGCKSWQSGELKALLEPARCERLESTARVRRTWPSQTRSVLHADTHGSLFSAKCSISDVPNSSFLFLNGTGYCIGVGHRWARGWRLCASLSSCG